MTYVPEPLDRLNESIDTFLADPSNEHAAHMLSCLQEGKVASHCDDMARIAELPLAMRLRADVNRELLLLDLCPPSRVRDTLIDALTEYRRIYRLLGEHHRDWLNLALYEFVADEAVRCAEGEYDGKDEMRLAFASTVRAWRDAWSVTKGLLGEVTA